MAGCDSLLTLTLHFTQTLPASGVATWAVLAVFPLSTHPNSTPRIVNSLSPFPLPMKSTNDPVWRSQRLEQEKAAYSRPVMAFLIAARGPAE
jgi:hypothetical protein